MIAKKPFVGLGAATFPIYYYAQYGIYMGHAHNLFLDYAFSFGIFVALIVFTNIFLLGYICFKKIYFPKVKKNLESFFYERAWFASFLVLLFSQMFDVQYFDLRISLSFWILLSGMKCIVSEVPKEQTKYLK